VSWRLSFGILLIPHAKQYKNDKKTLLGGGGSTKGREKWSKGPPGKNSSNYHKGKLAKKISAPKRGRLVANLARLEAQIFKLH